MAKGMSRTLKCKYCGKFFAMAYAKENCEMRCRIHKGIKNEER